jgi:hypothetical protein
MSSRIYWVRQSIDDDGGRPDVVTYYDPEGKFKTEEGFKAFATNCRVSAGYPGHPPQSWFVPDLYASRKGATPIESWDYYMCATFGAFSKRAIDVLALYFGDRFVPLPANLENHSYYCLHCRSRIDCLDCVASKIEYFDHDPRQVMTISKHVFRKEMLVDPMIFAIPEAMFHLYCTDSIPEITANASLRGFEFQLVDGEEKGEEKGKA